MSTFHAFEMSLTKQRISLEEINRIVLLLNVKIWGDCIETKLNLALI